MDQKTLVALNIVIIAVLVGMVVGFSRQSESLNKKVSQLQTENAQLQKQAGDFAPIDDDDAVYSLDGRFAATFNGEEKESGRVTGVVTVCNIRTRKIVQVLKNQPGAPLCFSPNNAYLLIGDTVVDWRAQKAVQRLDFPGRPQEGSWVGDVITIEGSSPEEDYIVRRSYFFADKAEKKKNDSHPLSIDTRGESKIEAATPHRGWRLFRYFDQSLVASFAVKIF